jgi:hypothetical protein
MTKCETKKPVTKVEKPKQTRSTRKMTVELFKSICNELSDSELGLNHFCKINNTSPGAFRDLMMDNEELSTLYTRAREYQSDYLFDLQRQIVMRRDEDHTPFTGANVVNRDRLIADTIKWQASKLNKRKYGEKLDITSDEKQIEQPLFILPTKKED